MSGGRDEKGVRPGWARGGHGGLTLWCRPGSEGLTLLGSEGLWEDAQRSLAAQKAGAWQVCPAPFLGAGETTEIGLA